MNIHQARAQQLLGVRFRPQGRNRETGLDCVGVIQWVYALPPSDLPSDYRLRGDHLPRARQLLSKHFFKRPPHVTPAVGDLLLLSVAADQIHFAVQCGGSFIHADAGLLKTVEVPGDPPWPTIGVYRHRKD